MINRIKLPSAALAAALLVALGVAGAAAAHTTTTNRASDIGWSDIGWKAQAASSAHVRVTTNDIGW
ncbi:hypothetical protein ABZ479_29860 [Streptomyces sp. NPDC005722]